jgi:hypothetical protein
MRNSGSKSREVVEGEAVLTGRFEDWGNLGLALCAVGLPGRMG